MQHLEVSGAVRHIYIYIYIYIYVIRRLKVNKAQLCEEVRGVETSSKHSQFVNWTEMNDELHDTAASPQKKESALPIG